MVKILNCVVKKAEPVGCEHFFENIQGTLALYFANNNNIGRYGLGAYMCSNKQ
jgi:hypothetical protein